MNNDFGKGCALVIVLMITVFVVSLIFCYPLMLLWNWLMPVFGLPELTFWQMFALEIICNFLFKSTNTNVKS